MPMTRQELREAIASLPSPLDTSQKIIDPVPSVEWEWIDSFLVAYWNLWHRLDSREEYQRWHETVKRIIALVDQYAADPADEPDDLSIADHIQRLDARIDALGGGGGASSPGSAPAQPPRDAIAVVREVDARLEALGLTELRSMFDEHVAAFSDLDGAMGATIERLRKLEAAPAAPAAPAPAADDVTADDGRRMANLERRLAAAEQRLDETPGPDFFEGAKEKEQQATAAILQAAKMVNGLTDTTRGLPERVNALESDVLDLAQRTVSPDGSANNETLRPRLDALADDLKADQSTIAAFESRLSLIESQSQARDYDSIDDRLDAANQRIDQARLALDAKIDAEIAARNATNNKPKRMAISWHWYAGAFVILVFAGVILLMP